MPMGEIGVNHIADNNYLYSGLAKTLYEYAFDTILPKYTPLFEDELFSKQASAIDKNEPAPFIKYTRIRQTIL